MIQVSGFDNNGSGGSNFNAPIEYQYIINIGCDNSKLKKLIDSLKIKITLLKSKVLPLNDADTWRLYFNKRHLDFALQQKTWCLCKQGIKDKKGKVFYQKGVKI